MASAKKILHSKEQALPYKPFNLSIGGRLSLAFVAVILLTGLIGILAIQQISSLTNKAIDLNARDLPEATTLERLRTLFYRQDDLEHSLIHGYNVLPDSPSSPTPDTQTFEGATVNVGNPGASPTPDKQTQRTVTELATVLKEIARDCQQLLAFERSEQGENLTLIEQLSNTANETRNLSARIQALIEQGHVSQASAIDFKQQEPLLLSAVTTLTRLIALEQAENANDTAQTQQDSQTSILFLIALTASCLLLSIALAILMTRSLTRPLKALLHSTEAIAAGNLTVEPKVKRTDEIGRLASAYDKMRMSLRATIARLQQERQHIQAIIDASVDGI